MKAYKGFNKDLTCRGFQYKEGETFHEDKAELCDSGFHACKDPLDCFGYYAPGSSVYHEVELDEVSGEFLCEYGEKEHCVAKFYPGDKICGDSWVKKDGTVIKPTRWMAIPR